MDDPDTDDDRQAQVLGRLVWSATAIPRGAYRASAARVTVQGPPPSHLPRRFSPFRDDGPPRSGASREECELVLEGRDRWRVATSGGGEYRRTGGSLLVSYPGHEAGVMDVDDVRAPNADWPYYAGHWAEELVLPHRLVGLLDELVIVEDALVRPRLKGVVSLRQPEAYEGIAGEEVLEVEFTADLEHGVILEARATTWDHRVSVYVLEVLSRPDRP
ncbi:hypothetical protein [Actinomycetospora sp. CA-084318]|uniref:hypothetical protein n=1 Tax=Actinomycetospora sp. CA-084318 TaxID=3239892 RepID=UPI003D95B9AA